MFAFPCVYSDKLPLCCCLQCRMSLWRRHTEGVLSVCLHFSAPYIFWVGWVAVREKLGRLVVWLDMKARAALTCCCGMDLFSVCLQSLLCSKFVITARVAPKLPCLFLFVLDWCVHVYVHPYLSVCVFVGGFDVFSSVCIAHTGTVSSCTTHLCSHFDVAGKKIWHFWFLQGYV